MSGRVNPAAPDGRMLMPGGGHGHPVAAWLGRRSPAVFRFGRL